MSFNTATSNAIRNSRLSASNAASITQTFRLLLINTSQTIQILPATAVTLKAGDIIQLVKDNTKFMLLEPPLRSPVWRGQPGDHFTADVQEVNRFGQLLRHTLPTRDTVGRPIQSELVLITDDIPIFPQGHIFVTSPHVPARQGDIIRFVGHNFRVNSANSNGGYLQALHVTELVTTP